MRSITVQSHIVSFLEARFLLKIQGYLNNKLDRSQAGFIQKIGTQVHLVQTIERIMFQKSRSAFMGCS